MKKRNNNIIRFKHYSNIKTKINKKKYFEKRRLEILNLSKKIVINNGWNNDLFNKIENQKKIKLNELSIMFPGGYNELLEFSINNLNSKLQKKMENYNLNILPIHKRIKKILLQKIIIMNEEKDFYSKIFFYLLLPKKNSSNLSKLYKSSDLICNIAKDQSTDFNFYTKRIILSSIYFRTILHFFNNNNLDETELVLDNSLQKVSKIPLIKNKFKSIKKNFPNILKLLIS